MRIALRTLTFITLLIGLAGCGTTSFQVGRDFDPGTFAVKVVRGKTTETDVLSWLGSPTSTGIRVETDGQRYTVWTYYFASGEMADLSDSRLKTLEVKFDQNSLVQGYAWSTPNRVK
jgi:outer membrane protein assembly factor BamE (lipoprotein component of BamABCDE complex)